MSTATKPSSQVPRIAARRSTRRLRVILARRRFLAACLFFHHVGRWAIRWRSDVSVRLFTRFGPPFCSLSGTSAVRRGQGVGPRLSQRERTHEVIPVAVGADLDDVDVELVVLASHPGEVFDRPRLTRGPAQGVAVDIVDMALVLTITHRAGRADRLAVCLLYTSPSPRD